MAPGRVRAIEYRLRSVSALEPAIPSYARYVGRVGALAVALGVGSAVAAVPLASADTTGSAGSTGSGSADTQGSASASASTKATVPSRRAGRGSDPSAVSSAPSAGSPTGSHAQAPGPGAATRQRSPDVTSVLPSSTKTVTSVRGVSAPDTALLSWLQTGSDGDAPTVAPVALAERAASRQELGVAASVTTAEPVGPVGKSVV